MKRPGLLAVSGEIDEHLRFLLTDIGSFTKKRAKARALRHYVELGYDDTYGAWVEQCIPSSSIECIVIRKSPWWRFWDRRYHAQAYIQFKNENDAFAFKLRWL